MTGDSTSKAADVSAQSTESAGHPIRRTRPGSPGKALTRGGVGTGLSIGDYSAIAARLRPFVARRVAAADVDDVLQNIFVRMQRGLPTLRDEQRFSSWLFQVARSAVAEHGRVRARHPVVDDTGGGELPAPTDDDDREAARSLAGCVSLFVAQLPSPYRQAVTLVELEGLTIRDAAERVGLTVSGMKSRVQRGREQLRRVFERCCDIALDERGKVTGYVPRVQPCTSCK